MENRVITISREYGSGGRMVGRKLAEKLGIHCYDADLIQRIVDKSGYSADYVKEEGESAAGGVFSTFLVDRTRGMTTQDNLWNVQCQVIAELADKESCVIVGVPEDSVVRRRKEKDKRRAAYYQFYTDMKWGDARNYHICLDSGELGIDKCVDILAQLY